MDIGKEQKSTFAKCRHKIVILNSLSITYLPTYLRNLTALSVWQELTPKLESLRDEIIQSLYAILDGHLGYFIMIT